MNIRPGDSIPLLCKELRKESAAVSVRKLMRLDGSDRTLIESRLRAVINSLLYIQTVADARCSVVVETFEYYGGTVPTVRH